MQNESINLEKMFNEKLLLNENEHRTIKDDLTETYTPQLDTIDRRLRYLLNELRETQGKLEEISIPIHNE